MFISYNPDTPALQLLHNNSYTTKKHVETGFAVQTAGKRAIQSP
jgi:hypothetical protein